MASQYPGHVYAVQTPNGVLYLPIAFVNPSNVVNVGTPGQFLEVSLQ
jgi:hypothetical protein